MSSDLQPVYTASAEINQGNPGEQPAAGWGLYFGQDDERNQGGRIDGDTFDAELKAINELLLFALKEAGYGYRVHTTSSKALEHIKRGSQNSDSPALAEIHSNMSRCLHKKVDIDFERAGSKDDLDNIHEAEKIAAESTLHA